MIQYRTLGFSHVFSVFSLRGSVLPYALCWGIFSGCLGLFVFHYGKGTGRSLNPSNIRLLETAFTQAYFTILGFLLSLRAQMAYTRYWEGVTLLQQTSGVWLNAVSSVIAFSNPDHQRKLEVTRFQQLIVRLMSLLFSSALQQVCMIENKEFETIDLNGIDAEHLAFLADQKDKCEIILQWIQKLVTDGVASNIQCAPPPIMARVFQELATGIVNIKDARKISTVPFPFPFAQMCITMLLLYSGFSGIICGWYATRADFCFFLAFLTNFVFWAVYYTSLEIEMPFRDASNGLDIGMLSKNMNTSLLILLDDHVIVPPSFEPTDAAYPSDRTTTFSVQTSTGRNSSKISRVPTLTSTVTWEQLKFPHLRTSEMSNLSSKADHLPFLNSSAANGPNNTSTIADRQAFAFSKDGGTSASRAGRSLGDGTDRSLIPERSEESLFSSIQEEASDPYGVHGRDGVLANEVPEGGMNFMIAI